MVHQFSSLSIGLMLEEKTETTAQQQKKKKKGTLDKLTPIPTDANVHHSISSE